MTKAVDYSFARPSLDLLKRHGYVGVLRYLATLPNPKVILKPEFDALMAAGLPVGFVWEVGTDWTTWNGAEADRQLDALGVGNSTPIYWAVDRSVSVSFAVVGQMLDGVNSRRPRGVYGGSGLVEWQIENGHARYGWVAGASSWNPGPAPKAHLQQLVGAPIAGTDENAILQDDWGQWPRENDVGTIDPEQWNFIAAGVTDLERLCQVQIANAINDPNVGLAVRLERIEAALAALAAKPEAAGGLAGDVPFTGTIHAGG